MRDRDRDSELIGCVRVPIEKVLFMVDGAQMGADIYYTRSHTLLSFGQTIGNPPLEEAPCARHSPSPSMGFSRDWLNDWLEMEP